MSVPVPLQWSLEHRRSWRGTCRRPSWCSATVGGLLLRCTLSVVALPWEVRGQVGELYIPLQQASACGWGAGWKRPETRTEVCFGPNSGSDARGSSFPAPRIHAELLAGGSVPFLHWRWLGLLALSSVHYIGRWPRGNARNGILSRVSLGRRFAGCLVSSLPLASQAWRQSFGLTT